jgi:hypothetical protein
MSDHHHGLAACILSAGPSQDKRKRLGVLLIFWWRIWKERNYRIFDNICSSPKQVAAIIIDEAKL